MTSPFKHFGIFPKRGTHWDLESVLLQFSKYAVNSFSTREGQGPVEEDEQEDGEEEEEVNGYQFIGQNGIHRRETSLSSGSPSSSEETRDGQAVPRTAHVAIV